MRKTKFIAIVLMLFVISANIVGCTKVSKETTSNEIKNEETQVDKDSTEKINYNNIYKKVLDKLILEYGKAEDKGDGMTIKGVKYGKLIDFNKDGTPELVIIHDMMVLVYKVNGDNAECIYEAKIGSRYGQTDVSYSIGINDSNEKVSLVVYHAEKPWDEEAISIVTIENGNVAIREISANAKENNDMPIRDNLIEYYLDSKPVTKDEYNNIYDSVVKNSKQIDACWNEEPATVSEFDNFLKSLDN